MSSYLNYLLPRTCVICGLNSQHVNIDLCSYCCKHLPWLKNACYHCGLELQDNNSIKCNKCNDNVPMFNRCCALWQYSPPIPRLMSGLKFGGKLNVAYTCGALLAIAIKTKWYKTQALPEIIIPVPLHRKRLQQRGYNQALEISRPISKALQIPIDVLTCQRIKHTKPQTRLSKVNRVQNLTAAFKVLPHKYQHVALVDDVVTTASTIRAISKALTATGVTHVDIWCVARA